jgi:stage II sporulation protein AA (anti-sigma F factor antagonist)
MPRSRSKASPEDAALETGPDAVVRVSVSGEVDMSRYRELDRVLASAGADATTLEIDLSAVSFMDSQGLRLLLRALERADGDGRRVVLVDPSPSVGRLLDVAGVRARFAVEGDR